MFYDFSLFVGYVRDNYLEVQPSTWDCFVLVPGPERVSTVFWVDETKITLRIKS